MSEFFTVKKKTQERLITQQERISAYITPLAYDDKEEIFLCDDKTLGIGFLCNPLTGTSEMLEEQANALLNESYPPNTQMQIIMFRSPDITKYIGKMEGIRQGFRDPLLSNVVEEKAEYFQKYTDENMRIKANGGMYSLGLVHDLKLIITVKIPISSETPTEKDIEKVKVVLTNVKTTLVSLQLRPSPLNAQEWINIMSTMLNWGGNASWRTGACQWDTSRPLCEQVMDYDTDLEITKDYLRLGDQYAMCLSAKRFPDHMYFGDAILNAGDLSGGHGGVRQQYLVCTNIFFPETDSAKQKLDLMRQYVVNQADTPLVKSAPVLIKKKEDFDTIYESIQQGMRPLRIAYHVVVFAKTKEEVDAAAMAARNFWRTNRVTLMVDRFIQLPVLINCLPLCCDAEAVVDLRRHKTMTPKEASPLLPIFGEWKGTGTPHISMLSRNMQLMSLSFHDTGSNMNGILAAQSGSGKSFLTNEIISSYLSEGAQVWVIETGRSFQKLCNVFGGDFVHFGASSSVCLNPFSMVMSLDGTAKTRAPDRQFLDEDDDGEEDVLVGLLEAMASPTEKLSDFQLSALKKTLSQVWTEHHRNTTVDLIQAALLEHEDQRVQDIGHQLHAFTSSGSYGRFFSGQTNVEYKNKLTVLELEELNGRKHLQQVVLLQLIYQIQQEIYMGDRNKKKILIVDEAWGLLKSGDIANFLEAAYRRFRKYGGSVIVIMQSIHDLYENPSGRAIAENSATTILLGQKTETINNLRDTGRIAMSDFEHEQLKTIKTIPGVYSEMYIKSEFGAGIGRLIVNDFQKLLYSTNAEEVNQIKNLCDTGLTVAQAINKILESRDRRAG